MSDLESMPGERASRSTATSSFSRLPRSRAALTACFTTRRLLLKPHTASNSLRQRANSPMSPASMYSRRTTFNPILNRFRWSSSVVPPSLLRSPLKPVSERGDAAAPAISPPAANMVDMPMSLTSRRGGFPGLCPPTTGTAAGGGGVPFSFAERAARIFLLDCMALWSSLSSRKSCSCAHFITDESSTTTSTIPEARTAYRLLFTSLRPKGFRPISRIWLGSELTKFPLRLKPTRSNVRLSSLSRSTLSTSQTPSWIINVAETSTTGGASAAEVKLLSGRLSEERDIDESDFTGARCSCCCPASSTVSTKNSPSSNERRGRVVCELSFSSRA
mmetsp:Transcript_66902/g.134857  ORF Transcript_66902/g.134857 Transcript_66902/m.134857 type:complete len:332 (-) Transcript_66902:362-1357(-)